MRLVPALGVAALAILHPACGGDPPSAAYEGWGAGPRLGVVEGPCTEDGAVRECHIDLGVRDGLRTCQLGQQECRAGLWTSCGGDVTLASYRVDNGAMLGTSSFASGLRPLSGGAETNPCVDPCDAYCRGENVADAGLQAEAGSSSSGSLISGTFGANPGWTKKMLCDQAGSMVCDGPFNMSCNGETHYSVYDTCLQDYRCDTTLHECVKNGPDWTWPTAVCPVGAGPDITVNAACYDGTKNLFPVCNRGNTTIAAGSILRVGIGNPSNLDLNPASGCTPPLASTCSTTLASPLAPGKCFTFDETNCPAWPNGNRVGHAWVTTGAGVRITECGEPAYSSTSTAERTFTTPSADASGWTGVTNAAHASPANGTLLSSSFVGVNSATDAFRLPNASTSPTGWGSATSAQSSVDAGATARASFGATIAAGASVAADTGGGGDTPWTNISRAQGTADGLFATSAVAKGKLAQAEFAYSALAGTPIANVSNIAVAITIGNGGVLDADYKYSAWLLDGVGVRAFQFATNVTVPAGAPAVANYSVASASWAGKTLNFANDLVQVEVSRANVNGTNHTISLDSVVATVTTSTTAKTQEWSTFNIAVPSGTVTQIDWEAGVRGTSAGTTGQISVAAYASGTAITPTRTLTGAAIPTTLGAANWTWSDSLLSLPAANVANGTFTVRATATGPVGFVAELDYLRVRVTYQTAASTTRTLTLSNFGFASPAVIPAGSTVTGITVKSKWHASTANCTMSMRPIIAGSPLGTATSGNQTTATEVTHTTTGLNYAPALVANGSLEVNLNATNAAGTTCTANFDYVSVILTYGTPSGPGPGCKNNWADVKMGGSCTAVGGGGYGSVTRDFSYAPTCAFGTRLQWKSLGFDAVTPCSPGSCSGSNAAKVTFSMQTAPKLPDGGAGTFTSWAQVASAPNAPAGSGSHPASCPLTGPSPCPVDVATALGATAMNHELMNLRVKLDPTPDGQQTPILNGWQLTYRCVPSE